MAKPIRRYWDSSCFLAWLLPEPARLNACREVIKAAEQGKVQIVTSTISLTEVIKINKGPVAITREAEEKISAFFKQDYILLVQVTRHIAEAARSLIWTYPALRPKDAIHAATAIHTNVLDLHTFDKDFLPLDDRFGSSGLRVTEPSMPQMELPLSILPGIGPEEEEVDQPEVN